jgi:hypothetical protein
VIVFRWILTSSNGLMNSISLVNVIVSRLILASSDGSMNSISEQIQLIKK